MTYALMWINALLVPIGAIADWKWQSLACNAFVALFLQLDAIRSRRG